MAIEIYKNAYAKLSETEQELYVCPPDRSAVVHSIYCSNLLGQTTYPSFRLFDASANAHYYLGRLLKIPIFSTLAWDKPINLEAGDSIKVVGDSDLCGDIFLSVMELYNNTFEKYRNASKILTTSLSTLYTCPSTKANAIFHGFQFSNIDNDEYTTITVVFEDENQNSIILGQNIKIPPVSVFVWDKTINLLSNQKIKVQCNLNNKVHCVSSILEIEST